MTSRQRLRPCLLGLLWLLLLACAAVPAAAHEPFEITSNARLFADKTTLEVLIADSTSAALCLPDARKLDATQFARHRALLVQCGAGLFQFADARGPLAVRTTEVTLTPENDLLVKLTYPPPAGPSLRIVAVHLARLSDPTYGATLTVTGDRIFLGQKLLRADDDAMLVKLPGATSAGVPASPADPAGAPPVGANSTSPPSADAATASPPSAGSAASFLRLGIEHILGGYDHLLFLAGLLLVCHRWRSALWIVTAFTLAHSITLALAGLGIVAVPSRLVEAAIAATIVYVGVDNLLRGRDGREPGARWLLTFVFGLLHGLGFASALAGIGLPRGMQSVVPLLSFNIGVELGQLAVAAVALPLLFWLRRSPRFLKWGVPALSAMVALAGVFWLLQRTLLA
ncbi:MAG: HupE/UreJ family protein [Massilia sp.]